MDNETQTATLEVTANSAIILAAVNAYERADWNGRMTIEKMMKSLNLAEPFLEELIRLNLVN